MKKRLFVIAVTVMIGAAACGGNDDAMGGHDMSGSSASASAVAS